MRFTDLSFPHPVLGLGDSIQGVAQIHPAPEIVANHNAYVISITCRHDNFDLSKLINEGLAEYICEVNCTGTLYRRVFRSNNHLISFEIPRKSVKGKVTFTCSLALKSPIHQYRNTNLHPDYDGFDFELDEGDIVAYFGEFSFNADINYEKLKAVSSFMEVVENKDPAVIHTNIDLSKSKIEIQMPTEDYVIFNTHSISKEWKFAPIFHASLVLNALLIALYSIDSHRDKLWAKVIEYRLRSDKAFESLSIEERENIPEIAQRLLGNPFSRLMSGLSLIVDEANKIEE